MHNIVLPPTVFKDITEPVTPTIVTAVAGVIHGPNIPPQQRILLYSAGEWENFVLEWAHFCLKKLYQQVQKFSGANDRGLDVVGFSDAKKLQGVWDNYQCKHYNRALRPADVFPEMGKLLWHCFQGEFVSPRRYFFVAPFGAGTMLAGLLAHPDKLRAQVLDRWDKDCRAKITETADIPLEGKFLAFVKQFDFSTFDAKTSVQIVDDHKSCPFHAVRFGGGLPDRPLPDAPPTAIAPHESRYVAQLLQAYADHKKKPVPEAGALSAWPPLSAHFGRQRVAFYHAESLRVFARDSVPPGTFESLQEEIFVGVVDEHDADHPDGYTRVCAVTKAAREMSLDSNPLITHTKPQDRDGICHQLANEDRLKWTKP